MYDREFIWQCRRVTEPPFHVPNLKMTTVGLEFPRTTIHVPNQKQTTTAALANAAISRCAVVQETRHYPFLCLSGSCSRLCQIQANVKEPSYASFVDQSKHRRLGLVERTSLQEIIWEYLRRSTTGTKSRTGYISTPTRSPGLSLMQAVLANLYDHARTFKFVQELVVLGWHP